MTQNIWTNVFGLILSLAFIGWGYLSTNAGISQEHAGPMISGYAFKAIGYFGIGWFSLDLIIKIFEILRR